MYCKAKPRFAWSVPKNTMLAINEKEFELVHLFITGQNVQKRFIEKKYFFVQNIILID